MMLETLGEEKAAARIEKAVMKVVAKDLKSLGAGPDGQEHERGRRPRREVRGVIPGG